MAWARWRTVAGATLVGLVLVGCSGDDAGTSQEDVADDAAPPVDGDGSAGEAATDAPSGDEAADRGTTWPGGARAASGGRQVVRSAEIVLEVDDSAQAASEVEDLAERVGGFVAESDLRRDEDGVVEGTLTLRVPSDALESTVADLDELALAVPVRRVDERDVTAEVTDLEAELTNLTAYEAELRALLTEVREQTSRPEDLLSVFDRINAVRSEIERTQGRLAVLEDQVAMARIDVTLRPAVSATPVTDPGWAPGDTLRGALAATTRALAGIADLAIRVVVTGVPVALVLGAPPYAAWRWWRRRAGTPGDAHGSPGSVPPPPAGTVGAP